MKSRYVAASALAIFGIASLSYGLVADDAGFGLVLAGCAWLGRRYQELGPRLLVYGIAAFYMLFIGYALLVWL